MKLILLLCAAVGFATSSALQRGCPQGMGEVFKDGDYVCEPCPMGSFASNDTVWEDCDLCPFGFTNGVTGAIDDSGCTKCIEGYMRDADGNCAVCPKGTYSNTIDAASCTSCPAGQTTAREGRDNANECFDPSCAAGQGYHISSRQCKQCTRGYYSPDGQTIGCLKCPEGYTTYDTGSTSADQCKGCFLGYKQEEGVCVPCPVGTRSGDWGSGLCIPCPEGMTTFGTASLQCDCKPGYYKKNWYDEGCTERFPN